LIDVNDRIRCFGCCACFNVCPIKCVSMDIDEEGFRYPVINNIECVNCRLCESVCPIIHKYEAKYSPKVYAAYSKSDEVRLKSSSGGIFSLVSEYVINRGGVVFGARFDDKFNVIHDYVDNLKDLTKLMGSKYTQSEIGSTYKHAKMYLDYGRIVMFSGTPCQIGGLKSYLKKEYDNLICQDIICHGVPSPKVWEKYVAFRQEEAGAAVKEISFRNKSMGWKKYAMSFLFDNETKYIKCHQEDLMMKAFLNDICLRPSCYNCLFKSAHRASDITLADFWGIENILPAMDDDKGTSLVISNNNIGDTLLENIKSKIVIKQVEYDTVNKYNHSYRDSAKMSKRRTNFFKEIDSTPIDNLIEKYSTNTFAEKVMDRLKRIAHAEGKI